MGSNSKEYIEANKAYLNKRRQLSFHNKNLKIDYSEYEKKNGIDKTIIWIKIQKMNKKYGLENN